MEKVERQIAELNTKISAIYDIVSKPRTTPTAKDSKHECCWSGLTNHQIQLSVDGFYVDSQYRVREAADGDKIFCH